MLSEWEDIIRGFSVEMWNSKSVFENGLNMFSEYLGMLIFLCICFSVANTMYTCTYVAFSLTASCCVTCTIHNIGM